METINPIAFTAVGVAFFIGLSFFVFRYFLKRRKKKRLLEEEVLIALNCIKANEIERNSLWMCYRLLLSRVAYRPTQIHEDLINLNFPIEEKTAKLLDFFSPKPKKLWKQYVNIFFEPDLIPDRLLKPPSLGIKGLEKKLKELQKLVSDQIELIDMFEDKTEDRIHWKDGTFLSKVEWQSKMREAGDLKEENELAEAMLKAEVDGAKAKLEIAINYVNTRQSGKSLKVGEKSIIAGTRHLNFKEVKKYCKKALEKVAELEAKDESKSIIDFCIATSLDLEQNFEDWAKSIFDRQFSFDGLQAYLKELGESQNTEIVATKEIINQVLNLFQDTIPKNWSSAKWGSLNENLEEVDKILNKIHILVKELEYWAREITELEERFQAVLVKEEQLEKDYGVPVTPSREWSNALASWKNDVTSLWAKGLQDELEKTLDSLETPLVKHSYKVGNRLDEAEKLAGVTTSTETVSEKPSSRFSTTDSNAAKLVEIKHAEQPLEKKPERSRKPPSFEPEKKLSGTMVRAKSPYSDDVIEVDRSLIGHGYELAEPAAPKKEKKKK